MGLVSRSLKLLLPRPLDEPPLSEGPGPSLPDRSARMRIGPLLHPAYTAHERFKRKKESHQLLGEGSELKILIIWKLHNFYLMSPLLAFMPPSFFHPCPPSLGERLCDMFGIVALAPIGRSCMGTGRLSSLSLRSVSRSSARGGGGGSALRTVSKFLG